jgi:hypothetical protein
LGTTPRPLGKRSRRWQTARKVAIFDDCRVETSPEKLPRQVGIIGDWLCSSPQRADAFDRGRQSRRWHGSTHGRTVAIQGTTGQIGGNLDDSPKVPTGI